MRKDVCLIKKDGLNQSGYIFDEMPKDWLSLKCISEIEAFLTITFCKSKSKMLYVAVLPEEYSNSMVNVLKQMCYMFGVNLTIGKTYWPKVKIYKENHIKIMA